MKLSGKLHFSISSSAKLLMFQLRKGWVLPHTTKAQYHQRVYPYGILFIISEYVNNNKMHHYPKYLVKDSDEFDSCNYPQIIADLAQINETSPTVPETIKADMLISFAKDHCLKIAWINAYPVFAELITTRALPIGDIELLFGASSKNSVFRQQFEHFLRAGILLRFRKQL